MGDGSGERDQDAVVKNRCDETHVRGMRQISFIGVVGDEYVTVRQIVLSIVREDPLHQMVIDRRVKKHPGRHQKAAFWVDDDAAEIARFADDGRIARPIEMVVQFLHQTGDTVAQQFDGNGIDGQI